MPAKRKDYDNAAILYSQGLSIQDIANFYSISRQAMWKILLRRGCVMRSRIKLGKDNVFFRGGERASDKCHNLFEKAIKKGLLTRPSDCSLCGSCEHKIEAHHDDYGKPMEVRWLCKKCHYEWHMTNIASQSI